MAERTVSVRLKAVIDDYKRAMGEAGRATTDFTDRTRQIGQLGQSTAKLGDSLTRNVTLPIVALGGVATKMAGDFDQAFTQMTTLAGVSGDAVAGLKESVLDLAGETGKAPQELAEALFFLQSSGLDSAQAMEALELSAKASAIGLGETQVVADAVSSVMLAYAESGLSAAEATDVLIATAKAGKAEPAELAGQMGRLVPISAELGITFGDVGAAIAALSTKGNDAAQATTQLSNVMSKLLKPSQQAQEALEGVGLSTDSIRELIAERGLLGTLEELKARLGNSGFVNFFEDIQAVQGALALTGGDLTKTRDIFEQVNDSVGATDEAFGKWADSMGAENARAFADFQIAMIRLGDIIAPIAADVLGLAAEIAEAFSSLPDWAQNAVVGLLAVAAAAGPVLSVGGRMITLFSTLMRVLANWAVPNAAIKGLGSSSTVASGGVGLLSNSMTALSLVALPLTVAGLGVAKMMQENAEAAAAAKQRVDALTDAMRRQADGAEGAVAEQAALLLTTGDVGEGMRRAGADLDVFTDALISGSDELKRLPDDLDDLDNIDDVLEEMAASGSELAAELLRLRDSGEMSGEEMARLLFRLRALSDDFADATQATENQEFAQEQMAAETGAATAEIEAQTQALKDLADQLAAQFDPLFGLIAAENGVRDALQAETEALANLDAVRVDSASTLADIAEAEKAVTDAQEAATEAAFGLESAQLALLAAVQAGDVSFDDALGTLARWRDDGLITAAAADHMTFRIEALRLGLEDTAGQYGVAIQTNIDAVSNQLEAMRQQWDGRELTVKINAKVAQGGINIGGGVKLFHEGGVVPGPRGQDVAAILQAGETVLPLDHPLSSALSGNVTPGFAGFSGVAAPPVVVTINGAGMDRRLLEWLRHSVRVEGGGSVQVALGQ